MRLPGRYTSPVLLVGLVMGGVVSMVAVVPTHAVKPIHSLRGSEAGAQFGEAIDGLGDIDGDGLTDFIVGEPMSREGTGRAIVFSGKDRKKLYELRGSALNARFGYSVSGPGDVDGDHVPDFVVSSPLEEPGGKVRVYSGADGRVLYALEDAEAESKFGARVSPAGDVDGDGLQDLAISAPGPASPSLNGNPGLRGRVMIFSGANGTLLREHRGFQGIRGETRGSLRVFSGEGDGNIRLIARAAGDVDGDGFVDLLVGDTWAKFAAGEVFLFSGRDGSEIRKWKGKLNGTSYFGFSIDSLEDLDGDGYREILIGASGTFRGPHYGGEVQIRSGKTGRLVRRHLAPLGGHHYMGHAVRGAGDMDGDGVEEYLVGLPYAGPRIGYLRGAVWLYSGRTGEVLAAIDGPRKKKRAGPRPQFGYYLGAIGDVNGDKVTDIAVSAPFERNGRGRVRIYSGRELLQRGR